MTHVTLPNPFPGFNPGYQIQQTVVINTPTVNPIASSKHGTPVKCGNKGSYINFILDESGSMDSCLATTISGFNEYLQTQKKEKLDCWMSLTKFSSTVSNVGAKLNVQNFGKLGSSNYRPNGMTALYDAIGQTILKVDEELRTIKKKKNRPAVLITIMTDGHENSSTQFTRNDIATMIAEREKAGWMFVYLGANQDAWAVGSSLGIQQQNAFSYSTANMTKTMVALAESTVKYRHAMSKGLTSAQYSSEEGFFQDETWKDLNNK